MKTQGQILNSIYKELKSKRSRFSRNAFAKFLSIPSPRLHDFMCDKRTMTLETAEKIALRLNLDEQTKFKFFEAIKFTRDRSNRETKTIHLTSEQFLSLTDWHHFAILALTDTYDFVPDPGWISTRLNISKEISNASLEQLKQIGFKDCLEGRTSLGQIEIESKEVLTFHETIRNHKSIVEKITSHRKALTEKEQTLQSYIFAGDPRKLAQAEKIIHRFAKTIISRMETGRRSEVYAFNIQMLPLTQNLKSEDEDPQF